MTRFKAVVFDWAGTMIDFGSFAPMGAFVEAFNHFNIPVSIEDARAPMGMAKWDHVEAMLMAPNTAKAWEQRYGRRPTTADVDDVYKVFVPMNERLVLDYAELVPGAREAVAALRERGLKIGSTTGYTRSIMERVLPLAAAKGYAPDNLVCTDDLPEGRPGPFGMYKCFLDLVVHPPSAVIKVDDTEPGIGEGVAAGCVTVGVTMSGNYVGKTPEQLSKMAQGEIDRLRGQAEQRLRTAGANFVIDTVADLPALIEQLEAATADRGMPGG